jgi:hypothetical protein
VAIVVTARGRARRVEGDSVGGELVGRKDLEGVGEPVGGEVLEVAGDDRAGSGEGGGCGDVFVVGVRKDEGAFEGFPAGYLGVATGFHVLDQPRRPRLGFVVRHSPFLQLDRLVVFELVQDGRAPHRSVQTLDGQGQQEITLRAGPQDGCVE